MKWQSVCRMCVVFCLSLRDVLTSQSHMPSNSRHSKQTERHRPLCEQTSFTSESCNDRAITYVDLSSKTIDTCVNVSHNCLQALPRSQQLSNDTEVLDVSFNYVQNATDELKKLSALRELDVSANGLRTLSFLPDPCNLRVLHARRNALRSLDGSLKSCVEMETLHLSDNQVMSLPSSAFSGLRKLLNLHLRQAGLVLLNAATFDGLDSLIFLDLSHNGFVSLPSKVFSPLINLESLDLDSNMLRTLKDGIFSGLSNLTYLRLANNMLSSIHGNVFKGLIKLKSLSIAGNNLTGLTSDLFSDLRKIESISLMSNDLRELPERLFANLSSLREVDLTYNQLAWVPVNLFTEIRTMERIDLSHNQLAWLPTGLFSTMFNLTSLDLSYNRFTNMTSSNLTGLQVLQSLDMTHNRLPALPQYDEHWPAIGNASFADNCIEDASERQLRSWLTSHKAKNVVMRRDTALGTLRCAASLQWADRDAGLRKRTEHHCACYALETSGGEERVRFCVDVPCRANGSAPDVPKDWKVTAMALGSLHIVLFRKKM